MHQTCSECEIRKGNSRPLIEHSGIALQHIPGASELQRAEVIQNEILVLLCNYRCKGEEKQDPVVPIDAYSICQKMNENVLPYLYAVPFPERQEIYLHLLDLSTSAFKSLKHIDYL
jgi:hypothetical protein